MRIPVGVNWVIRAGEKRRSRLHDYDNRLLPPNAVVDVPRVLRQAIRRRRYGWRPILPWVPYPAIRRIQELIQPDWDVLEMGSGNSTLWFATRVKHIRSMESDPYWYSRVKAGLAGASAAIDYEFINVDQRPGSYWELKEDQVESYDFVMVDGLFREECIKSALRAARPGGYIYLDNIDSERAAFAVLKEAVMKRGGSIELLTGLPPAQPTVTTGALAHT